MSVERGRSKKTDKNLPSMALEPEPDIPPVPAEECREEVVEHHVPTADGSEAFITTRRRFHLGTGRLVDFAVMLWAINEFGDLEEVSRVDTSGGTVHTHTIDGDDHDTSEVPPDCRRNIDRAYAWGLDYCWNVAGRLL